MCVAMRSRNHRSCEITTAHPAKFSNASSKARNVFTSRSFVGSSSSRTFAPSFSIVAGDFFPNGFVWIERAALIDISELYRLANPDRAAVRLFLFRDHAKQRCL